MGRLIIFALGVVLGAALSYAALRYHFVRADEGWIAVPRTAPVLEDLVVDVRSYGVADWNAHRDLAHAIVQAGRADLIGQAAADDLRRAMDDALRGLMPESAAER